MSETKNEDRVAELGRITWHSTEEGGGPDVGISIGLGDNRMLWCGEISKTRWEEASEETRALGDDFGWWLILYEKNGSTIIGKCASPEAAQGLMDQLAAVIKGERHDQ